GRGRQPSGPPPRKTKRLWVAAAAASVLILGGIAYWKWQDRAAERAARPLTGQPQETASRLPAGSSPPANASAEQPKVETIAPAPEKAAPVRVGPKTWINPKDGQTYVWIPPGSFDMGCSHGDASCRDDEKPVHVVEIAKGFWLGRTEVTRATYRK